LREKIREQDNLWKRRICSGADDSPAVKVYWGLFEVRK